MVGINKSGAAAYLIAILVTIGLAGCAAQMGDEPVAPPKVTEAPQPETAPTPAATQPSAPLVLPLPPQPLAIRDLVIVRSSIPDAPKTLAVTEAEMPSQPTKILDPAAAERLFGNSGLTLQWVSWEDRGRVWIAVDEDGQWLLTGGQEGEDGARLDVEGFITEIGSDYFILKGTIKIFGTPDKDRLCNVSKNDWRFGITQNRKYWRLREFEWCDYLTDYIDIYF